MDNPSLIKDLRSIGLPEKAALIYAAVLEMGVAFPSKIAEVTKLNRSTVYKILTDLAIKGLVTELERNKKICYQAEKPGKLVNFAKSQIGLAEERFEHAKKILPDIEGLFAMIPNKPRVRFFEGMEGVLAIYEDHISEKQSYEMVAYSNAEELMKILPPAFVKKYTKAKEMLGITTRAILPDTPFNQDYNKTVYRNLDKKTQLKMKLIPAATFPYTAEITMYGKNKVSIINFHEKILIGVIIEDPTIVSMMRMVFELAWQGIE